MVQSNEVSGAGPLRSLAGLLVGWGSAERNLLPPAGWEGRGLPVRGAEGHVFLFGVTTDALRARKLSLQACPNSNLGSDSLVNSMPHSLLQSNPTLDGKTRSVR